VTTTDAISLSRLEALTRGMMARGADMWAARREALMILDRQLTGQASVIAYSRIYMISAILILALIPLLALVRQTKGRSGDHAIME
jgi:DHA2 family multidrug resistance protein